jgi:hypothetical protein
MLLLGMVILLMAVSLAPPPALPPVVQAVVLEAAPPAEPIPEAKPELPPEAHEAPEAPPADVAAPAAMPRKIPVVPRTIASPVKAAPKVAPVAALDLAALKARLRETTAFGVLTKLALQNQMDDLLSQFRVLHEGAMGVATLRAPFEALLAKVVGLLQEGDASLARAIAGSREAIWDVLSDPQKFDAAS